MLCVGLDGTRLNYVRIRFGVVPLLAMHAARKQKQFIENAIEQGILDCMYLPGHSSIMG